MDRRLSAAVVPGHGVLYRIRCAAERQGGSAGVLCCRYDPAQWPRRPTLRLQLPGTGAERSRRPTGQCSALSVSIVCGGAVRAVIFIDLSNGIFRLARLEPWASPAGCTPLASLAALVRGPQLD